MITLATFTHFYNELLSSTKDRRVAWKMLISHPQASNMEDLLQSANDMPDFGTNSIKFSGSYFAEKEGVGTLYLVEVYHPTTDPISGQLYLLSWSNDSATPINLSDYFNLSQGQLGALQILVENILHNGDVDERDIKHFISNFLT